MARNAAFGRPPASERLRRWWEARSKISRQNTLLTLGVGVLFVAIVVAATARDQSPASRVISSRLQPTTTLGLPTPSTVNIGDTGSASGSLTAADLSGLNTTSTTPAPAATPPPPPVTTTRAAAPAVATVAPAPATTVTNPDVIFSTVPPETTTTRPPTTTTKPAPTTTTLPPTTTTVLPPLSVPNLLAPG